MDINNLVEKAQRGDNSAKEQLINCFKPYIIKSSKSIYIKGYDLEDIMQIGYMTVIKAINQFDLSQHKDFIPYVITAIKNNYSFEIRKRCRINQEESLNTEVCSETELIDNIIAADDTEAETIRKDNSVKLYDALNKLNLEEKELIDYVFLKENTLKSYSDKKCIKYMTCVKRKNRTLKKLFSLLSSL